MQCDTRATYDCIVERAQAAGGKRQAIEWLSLTNKGKKHTVVTCSRSHTDRTARGQHNDQQEASPRCAKGATFVSISARGACRPDRAAAWGELARSGLTWRLQLRDWGRGELVGRCRGLRSSWRYLRAEKKGPDAGHAVEMTCTAAELEQESTHTHCMSCGCRHHPVAWCGEDGCSLAPLALFHEATTPSSQL